MHREALAANPNAYSTDLPRLKDTVVAHLRDFGFRGVSHARCPRLIDEFVESVFEAQGRKPFFHIEAPIPYCWNSPKDWDKDYIRYEWGHLMSRNQNANFHHIENICLQSARCNQHVQTSMDIDEVLLWLEGSAIAFRIREVLERRRELFASENWRKMVMELSRYR